MRITHRQTAELIFESPCSTMRETVLAAIKAKADLRSADLSSADLSSADLSYADLRSADLSYANLSYADLRSADLSSANLSYANLRSANLSYANLSSANLRYADLRSADLRSADLRSADLRSADLSYADLSYAKNSELAIAMTRILPQGTLIGWKKIRSKNGDLIAKLQIPEEAKRSHAFGRKCRAEWVLVLEIIGGDQGHSSYDSTVIYKAGLVIKPEQPFCEEWTEECASGIHFFITKEEAEAYSL